MGRGRGRGRPVQEGQAALAWRIAVWEHVEQVLADVEAGTRTLPTKQELLDEEYEKFDDKYLPSDDEFSPVKDFFTTYIVDEELQEIIDSKEFSKLNFHPAGESFKKLPKEYRTIIPDYIKSNVQLNRFANA